MNAYGYIRVSKDPGKEKISPEIQRQLIERYAHKERLVLLEVYGDIDVPSAKIDVAGTWTRLADSLSSGDLIITNDVTRLGRDVYETLTRVRQVSRLGVEVVSLEGNIDTDRAAGKFAFHVLLAAAQFINDQLSERMQAMHSYKAQRGEWHGGARPPYGYSFPGGKRLEVLEEEASVVRELYALRDKGWGYMAIAREMDSRGVVGKRGRMSYTSIRQILTNPTYTGKRVHKGEVYEGLHEAIVPEDIWERVQARNRQNTRSCASERYLLSGFMVCGDCGGRMKHWKGGSNGRYRELWQCKEARSFKKGKMVTIEDHLVTEWVLERFFRRIDEKRLEAAKKRVTKRAPKRETRAQLLRKQLETVESSLKRLEADRYDFAEPLVTPEQFREKNLELVTRKASLTGELQSLEDEARLDNVVYLERARTFAESWEGLNLDEQREALRLLVEKVIVHPRSGKKVDPGRVEIVWK